MLKLNVYSSKGIKKGTIDLPKQFRAHENLPLLAQAIRVYEEKRHPGLAKVKTRGEVSASTVKIWRQKGTGRARHGAVSAPIFVGGGVAHGPKGVKRKLTLPKSMKSKALSVALNLKAKEGKLLVVSDIDKLIKTRQASDLINQISKKEDLDSESKFTIVLASSNKNAVRVFRNIKDINIIPFNNLNAYDVFFGGNILLDENALMKESIKSNKRAKRIKRIKAEKKDVAHNVRNRSKKTKKKSLKSVKE